MTTPQFDEVHHAVGQQLGVHAEIAVAVQGGEDRVGDGTDPGLEGGAVADPLGDEARDAPVIVGEVRRRDLDQRIVRLTPPDDLGDVDLVASERAGHLPIGFEKEAGSPDERRDVVGVQPEAEVAMTVRRRRRGQHQRVTGSGAQDVAHLAEIVRDQVDRSLVEARPGDVGEKI